MSARVCWAPWPAPARSPLGGYGDSLRQVLTGCRPDVAAIQPDCGQCDDAHRRDTTRRIAAGNQLTHVATPVQDRTKPDHFRP